MFQEHVLGLANKKRLQFRKLLEETPQVKSCDCNDGSLDFPFSLDFLEHALEEG